MIQTQMAKRDSRLYVGESQIDSLSMPISKAAQVSKEAQESSVESLHQGVLVQKSQIPESLWSKRF